MLEIVRQHPRAVLYAAIVHIVLIGILVVSFRWTEKPTTIETKIKDEDIVKATTVDSKRIEKELKKLKAAETKKQRELEAAAEKAKKARLKEEKRLADARKKHLAEEKAAIEKRKKDELDRKKAEQKREKEAAERLKKEQDRLAKLQAERKKEEERLARIEQQKREDELKGKLAEEQQRLDEEKKQQALVTDKKRLSKITEYTLMIKSKVQQNWNIPASAKTGMSCEILVRLLPSGDVISMRLTKSSGDAAFDRSAENAIKKASPLPVPTVESGLFDAFREMNLAVTKEN